MASMLADHIAAYILAGRPFWDTPLFMGLDTPVTPYLLVRWFGRMAFPLFAFLLVEGFVHTRSRLRYGFSLGILAVISEIPWNLVHGGALLYPTQNVMFTLLLGYLGMCALEQFKGDDAKLVGSLLGLLCASLLLNADYGCAGFGFIFMLYLLRDRILYQAVLGSSMLNGHLFAGAAFIPISLYNGKRGFIRGTFGKYLFYAFYPAHLLVIWLIMRCNYETCSSFYLY